MRIKIWFSHRFRSNDVLRALAADSREFALLWLVFSMLDKLVDDDLTLRWIAGNAAFGLAMWISGAYFEFRKENDHA